MNKTVSDQIAKNPHNSILPPKLCQHNGVDVKSATQQVQGFCETTDVHKLAGELEERLPEQ